MARPPAAASHFTPTAVFSDAVCFTPPHYWPLNTPLSAEASATPTPMPAFRRRRHFFRR